MERYPLVTRLGSVAALKTDTPAPKTANSSAFIRALCRTRTGDPFLTMEVLYQLS